MTEKDFKKLLIDLDVSLSEIGRDLGISHTAVSLYFRGDLRSPSRRAAIKKVLVRRAKERGIELPDFWSDVAA